jgi:hypothetical protein
MAVKKKIITKLKPLKSYPIATMESWRLPQFCESWLCKELVYVVGKFWGVREIELDDKHTKGYMVVHRGTGLRCHSEFLTDSDLAIKACVYLDKLGKDLLKFNNARKAPNLHVIYDRARVLLGECVRKGPAAIKVAELQRERLKQAKSPWALAHEVWEKSQTTDYTCVNLSDLRKQAKEAQIEGWYRLPRASLVAVLQQHYKGAKR